MEKNKKTSKMYFEPEIARKVGVDGAVMYNNIKYWCDLNAENDKSFYDGYYWTRMSRRKFAEKFNFWKDSKVRNILKRLEKEKLIKSNNYNLHKYDQTKWYTCIYDNSPIKKSECTKGNVENSQPILNSNINGNNHINPVADATRCCSSVLKDNFVSEAHEINNKYITPATTSQKLNSDGLNMSGDDLILDEFRNLIQSENEYVRLKLEAMLHDKERFEKIIAIFIIFSRKTFESVEQIDSFIARYKRASKLLAPYSLTKIKETMRYLDKSELNFDWTLETVGKYIDRNHKKNVNASVSCVKPLDWRDYQV